MKKCPFAALRLEHADLSPVESRDFDLVYWLAVNIGLRDLTGRMSRDSGIAADLPRTAKRDGVVVGGGHMYGSHVVDSQSFATLHTRAAPGQGVGDEHMIAQRITDPSQLVKVLSYCGAPSVKRMVPVGQFGMVETSLIKPCQHQRYGLLVQSVYRLEAAPLPLGKQYVVPSRHSLSHSLACVCHSLPA